jgi:pilus assembly protein CpaC
MQMQRTWRAVAYLAVAVLASTAARAQAQQPEGAGGSTPSSTRATVVELPPAAEDQGIVRLSTAATAEDVIQPVLEIERGKTVLLKPAYDVKRIAVGDPEIVDFVVNGSNEIQLIAKSVGNTNVLIWDSGNRLQASIDIHVGAVRAQLVRELRRVLGRNDVSVDMAGESVVLRGTVPDLQTSEAADAVATAFFVEDEGGGGGAAPGAQSAAPVKEKRVINLLTVGGNQQVMLEVVVAELSRTVRRAIGTNFDLFRLDDGDRTQVTSLIRGLVTPTGMQNPAFTLSNNVDLAVQLLRGDDLYTFFIESLEANSLGKVLAEPRLVARSGQLASFLAGGEIPIPVPADLGDITIQFKRFGVQLEFIPTVLAADRIHLQVTPEVSQPDFDNGISIQGIRVPAFRSRRASTGVELADGQSFMIGGLLQDQVITDYERYPLLGDVPIIGNLLRSERFQRNETELVIIITPRLVQPLGPGRAPLPTDRYVEPGPFAFFLLGRIAGREPVQPPEPPRRDGPADAAPAPGPVVGEARAGVPVEGLIGDFGHQLRLWAPQGEQ